MSTNIRVESGLNQIVNTVTGQGEIRRRGLKCCPLCLLYGPLSDTFTQMLRMELAAKAGEEAVGIVRVDNTRDFAKDSGTVNWLEKGDAAKWPVDENNTVNGPAAGNIEEILDAVLDNFHKKMDEGRLERLTRFFVPVIFMAGHICEKELKQTLLSFIAQMKRRGYERLGDGGSDNYEIWYYCIFDYASADSAACRKQLDSLLDESGFPLPMCLYTQDYLAGADDQKYLKVVQSMAMHMFLKALGEKEADFLEGHARNSQGVFVTGYWKMDVLKQKTAGYLKKTLCQQEEGQEPDYEYTRRIAGLVDEIMPTDRDWGGLFCRMPVNYTEIGAYFPVRPCLFKKRLSFSYGEILTMLYGTKDAFRRFVGQNLPEELDGGQISRFFDSDLGNLYEVANWLEDALKEVKETCEKKAAEWAGNKKTYDTPMLLEKEAKVAKIGPKIQVKRETKQEKNSALQAILHKLRAALWQYEEKAIIQERKAGYANQLLEYLQTREFQRELQNLAKRKEEDKRYLSLVAREASANADRISSIMQLDFPVLQQSGRQSWKEDVLSEDFIKKVADSLLAKKQDMQEWTAAHADQVLNHFVANLQELKRANLTDQYYSARMNIPKDSSGKEYLYVGMESGRQDDEGMVRRFQDIAKLKLPGVKVVAREWEADMCFELFAVKRLQSLDEIYNMDGRGMARL